MSHVSSLFLEYRAVAALLFLNLGFSLHAQPAEWTDQRSEEIYLDKVLPLAGGRWAVMGRTYFGGSNMISVRNEDGTIAWEDIGPYFAGLGPGEVVLLPDSGLLHVGEYDGCDFSGPPSRVRRYSPDGTVLWERIMGSNFSNEIKMAAKGSTNLLAVASTDSVYIMDLDGNIVEGCQIQSANIRGLHWQGDSALLVLSGTSILRVDLLGNVLDAGNVGSQAMDLHYDGQQVFVLANNSVERFDPELNLLGTTPLALDGNSAFVVSEHGLFVNTTTGLNAVAVDGTVSLVFPWPPLPALTNTGCAVRDSSVLLLGNTSINYMSTGIIRRLSFAGDAAQYTEDVEVLLQVDSTWTEFINAQYWKRRADITGHVVNHGTSALNSVVLSMWMQTFWLLCSQPANRIIATDLALEPGDTISLPFGAVDVAEYITATEATGVGDICIAALAPNQLADRHPEDNTACSSVTFVLGEEKIPPTPSLALTPNPASSTCELTGLASFGPQVRTCILDATGRMALDRALPAATANGITFDVSALPSGSYVLVVEGERFHERLRFMVVHP